MPGKLAIIGGGAAGMMAAIRAAEALGDGSCIVLFDKNERLGRKIYLTGKGRCNLTNMRPWEEFSTHIHPNQGFLKHSFYAFSNEDTLSFFESLGVPTVVQQGKRAFPASLVAGDVARALERRVLELGVDVRYGHEIKSLEELDGFDAVIVATGGKSYPVTGSTGDGYRFAKEAGHTVTQVFPSETALLPADYDPALPGMEMKNVGLHLYVDRQIVQSEQGDFNFTGDGLESGIAYLVSRRAVRALTNGQCVDIILDLKPALSEEQLLNRLKRTSQLRCSSRSQKNARGSEYRPLAASLSPTSESVSNRHARLDPRHSGLDPRHSGLDPESLRTFMPETLIVPFLRSHPGLTAEKIPVALKSWPFRITSYKGYERAVVTAGGVSLKEIVPKTMASRLRPGLWFCGEVLDLDGDTGGYNLQIAFSTGAAAGTSAAKYLMSL